MAKGIVIESITDMEKDFAQWYTDVVVKAELADYAGVRGCIVYRPYGYAIWELIQKRLDAEFKRTGHENVYMPMFIPEGLLDKEKDHVEGFAPEVAAVTHGGGEALAERLFVRPTSETLFCDHYARIIHSYRDLPKLYNQWCSVVRWEKTTRPFLRGLEFLWQEGHTAHATAEEARAEALRILDIYADFAEGWLAMPVLKGRKTEREKFAGAEATFAIECLMHDGKGLQAGTTHDFGDGFAKAFGIQFTDRDNRLKHVYQSSWGVSTRLIGGVIMTHGDNDGLVLPPKVAPIQVVIVPIAANKPGVLEKARELEARLGAAYRVKLDDSDKSPGWKFSEWEMKGVPVRVEIGPKDIEAGQCVLVRRDTREKATVSLDALEGAVAEALEALHRNIYNRALENRANRTSEARSVEELNEILNEKGGFVRAMWCGDEACEIEVKERATATSRCVPFEQESVGETCLCCGKAAGTMVVWGRAY